MKIWNEGDKVTAVCDYCKSVREVIYLNKPYRLETGEEIPNVLQGFCTVCNNRLLLPPQSSKQIAPFYKS